MKTPTPRTDEFEALRDAMSTRASADYVSALQLCDELETELTASQKELAEVTEQRDRLAEALKRIADNNVQDTPQTNYAYEFGRMEGISKIALQSLTPNEL